MAESPSLNRAARIIADIGPQETADQTLRRHLADSTGLSSSERRAVSRAVFAYFRWFQWLGRGDSIQLHLAQALDHQRRFDLDPKSIKDETLAARAVPSWLASEMELTSAYLRQLQREPSLWIRARPGKVTELASLLGDCEPPQPGLPGETALRYRGAKDLFVTKEFHSGQFEIQDLGSQRIGTACAPKPKETWWDACAGEGGKTLHLGDLMGNTGLIWSSDRSARRLATLKRRAGRAKLFNYRSAAWDGGPKLPTKTLFDGVLLDAPCSGVGTWQRNPHARWTVTPADVAELAAIQGKLLAHASGAVKKGGRLFYAVCTLTRSETTAIVEQFQSAHPEFSPEPLSGLGIAGASAFLWPQDIDANGMYVASWRRTV